MKILFTFLILLCSFVANAEDIRCYSYGHLIYHHQGYDVSYGDDGTFVFTEAKTNKIVIMPADCVIKIDD